MPELNSPAPNFTLLNGSREAVSLSDFRGKKVVIAFLPGAFTGVCTTEICALQDAGAAFNEANATVLAISVDSPFANAAFGGQNGFEFPVLSDHTRATTNAYGVALHDFAGVEGYTVAQRSVFIVDEEGNLSWSWVAPNPGVLPEIDAIQAALA
jgi:peroxiredoxin